MRRCNISDAVVTDYSEPNIDLEAMLNMTLLNIVAVFVTRSRDSASALRPSLQNVPGSKLKWHEVIVHKNVFRDYVKHVAMQRCHIAQLHDGLKRSGKALLHRYQRKGNDFLGRIVAMDETWTRSYEPNLKRQSNEWKHPGSPRPKKVRPTQSAVKEMFIVAYDIDGIILHHAVPPRQTENADYWNIHRTHPI
ncbi:hypothetical protein ANN_25024 [Periplaneta americana]|uniref:PiggyBac transposable element-derived protein domain-containing protein n=1 Tax=Periplaneta americana TaxID=6978 RepID=A0ABQ8S0D7_PERAM|nr:hypothetical protein ANN_25024 [Periplaneta americana]